MFDFVVIDSGQRLDKNSQKIHQISDTVLLAAILTVPCIANVKKIFKIYDFWGYPSKGKVKFGEPLCKTQLTCGTRKKACQHRWSFRMTFRPYSWQLTR
jgi:hypothetical protein